MTLGHADAREAAVAKHVPFLRHVAEDMLKTKEGHFLMVVKIGGFCFQTADQAEIDMRLSSRNTIIRAMNDSRFAIYSHIIRREVRPKIDGHFDNWFCEELDRRYMANQQHKRMFVNDLYVTILRRKMFFEGQVNPVGTGSRVLDTLIPYDNVPEYIEFIFGAKTATTFTTQTDRFWIS